MEPPPPTPQRTVLITGATSGIGRAGAQALARLGCTVLVHARTTERGRPVLADLQSQVPQARFELVTGDLSDLAQVRTLAEQVRRVAPVLDVLWNNAGLMVTKPQRSADGFELQWAVNHLAGFVLTQSLLPNLEASPQGRVIDTSSFAHHVGTVPAGFALTERGYNGWLTYGDTKLANILFVRELSKRLAGKRITAHAFHPGYVRTEFGANGVPGQGNSGSWLKFVQIPVERGAETGVFLATSPEGGSSSGQYWSSCRVRRGSSRVRDDHAALLWALTEEALAKA